MLVFYPADWSPVCGDQVSLYNEMLSEFQGYGAQIVGISVDGAWCHTAFAKDRKLRFPLLADFEPKGDVAKRTASTMRRRAPGTRAVRHRREGIVRWRYVSPVGINPGAEGILDALETCRRRTTHEPAPPSGHCIGPSSGTARCGVVVVEYGDYQCPYCGAEYPQLKKVQKHFGDKICFVFRNFPLTQAHPHAERAAEFAEAAATVGKFWEMHDMLYENQKALEDESLIGYAARSG